jgi:hypothetical protein
VPELTTQEPSLEPLPPELAGFLRELRQHPLWNRLLQAYPQTTLRTYQPHRAGTDEQEKKWIFMSGKKTGEDAILTFLSGVDHASNSTDER